MLNLVKTRPVDFLNPKTVSITSLDLFRNLPLAALREIGKYATERHFGKHQSIFLEDDRALSLWFVKQGHVKEVHRSPDGRSQTLCASGPNGMFGTSAFDGGVYGFNGIAETDANLVSFPIHDFRILMGKYPDLSSAVLSKISNLLRRAKELQMLTMETAENRILHVVMELAKEYGDDIPLNRREIAEMASTSVETCIRTFSRLRAAGLIEPEHGKMMIKNRVGLKNRMEGS